MADRPDEFTAMIERARGGDAEALTQLTRQYEAEVRMVARAMLGPALRPYLDSLDLVQSVHRSLMGCLQANKLHIATPQNLIGLAVTMVRRKVARQWRRAQRQRRLDGAHSGDAAGLLASLATHEANPADVSQLEDAMRQVLGRLEASDRQLVELRLQGYSTAEAARHLGLDADVLRVRLSRLRQRLRSEGVLTDWL
jgi:RNA polymerase sigma-70 factor (ECF subfamily)